ncbi:acyltransferase family protein [Chiayiivirga flava]|uniref:Peptidoglycan/LPS O-acetylase OafA/YrhL n=1 Tax=Chiayiivirga flava TaxID=659595 RepID=A0A7W8D6W9_9GAMM|nr:acyltransferase [Chiayiivirga flava]MBB5209024.1 peptidoglycan/LPS O-acetylase OafA/YrhL [Chiayiivirga flava]
MLSFLRDNPNRYPLGYHAGLDGLRGTMTLGVMAAHVREAWCPGSFVYMDTFFLMSAYLITSLLLKGWGRSGEIGFAKFYARRALRLFPAFYAMIAAFCVAAVFLDDTAGHLRQALVAGLYVSNWTRAFGLEMPQFLGHTWSLAIEEQYYLLWPLLLAGLLRWSGLRLRTVSIVLCAAFAFALWRSWLTFDGAPIERLYNGTDTRADALLIGCALGLALALPQVRDNAAVQRVCRAAALPAVIVLLVAGYTLQWQMRWMYAGGSTLFACVSAVLVAALVLPQRTLAHRVFELPPLVFLGRICYGLYLWHFPIYNVLRFGLGLTDAWVAGIGVPLTFAIAMLSYRYIERPFLAIKDRMGVAKA